MGPMDCMALGFMWVYGIAIGLFVLMFIVACIVTVGIWLKELVFGKPVSLNEAKK